MPQVDVISSDLTLSAKTPWQVVVKRKLAQRQAAINPFLREQSRTQKEITDIDELSVLQAKLGAGVLTATEVITAYINRFVFITLACRIMILMC